MTPIPPPPSPPLPSSLIPFLRDYECKARVRTCTLVSHPSHALTLQNVTRHGTTSRLHWLETTHEKKRSPSTKERVQCLPTAAWMLQYCDRRLDAEGMSRIFGGLSKTTEKNLASAWENFAVKAGEAVSCWASVEERVVVKRVELPELGHVHKCCICDGDWTEFVPIIYEALVSENVWSISGEVKILADVNYSKDEGEQKILLGSRTQHCNHSGRCCVRHLRESNQSHVKARAAHGQSSQKCWLTRRRTQGWSSSASGTNVGRPLKSLAVWPELGAAQFWTHVRTKERKACWRPSSCRRTLSASPHLRSCCCWVTQSARHALALLSCPSPTEIWRTLASQEKIAVAAPVWPVNCRAWRVCPEVLPRSSVCNEIDRGGRLRTKNTSPYHHRTYHIPHTQHTHIQCC